MYFNLCIIICLFPTYFQKALSIRIKTLPNTHLHLVHSYGNIGNCYVYLNKTDKALLYYKKYITPIIKKNYGEKDIFTYKTFNNISYILLEKEAYQEAWEYLQILQKADISEPKELKAGIYENIGRYFLGVRFTNLSSA